MAIIAALVASGAAFWTPPPARADLLGCKVSFSPLKVVGSLKCVLGRLSGTVQEMVAAFQRGPRGLAEWMLRKFRGALEDVVKTVPPFSVFAKIWDLAGAIAASCKRMRAPDCVVSAVVDRVFPAPLPQAVRALLGGGSLEDRFIRFLALLVPQPIPAAARALLRKGSLGQRLIRFGEALLGPLSREIENAKQIIRNEVIGRLGRLFGSLLSELSNRALKPAASGLRDWLRGQADAVSRNVAERLLGRYGGLGEDLSFLEQILSDLRSGNGAGAVEKLAAFRSALKSLAAELPKRAVEYAVDWARGQALSFVLGNLHRLLKHFWGWAYQGVSAARNAVQGIVGSVPFAGGVLAAALGAAVDFAWGELTKLVERVIDGVVRNVADLAFGKLKEELLKVVAQGRVPRAPGATYELAGLETRRESLPMCQVGASRLATRPVGKRTLGKQRPASNPRGLVFGRKPAAIVQERPEGRVAGHVALPISSDAEVSQAVQGIGAVLLAELNAPLAEIVAKARTLVAPVLAKQERIADHLKALIPEP